MTWHVRIRLASPLRSNRREHVDEQLAEPDAVERVLHDVLDARERLERTRRVRIGALHHEQVTAP